MDDQHDTRDPTTTGTVLRVVKWAEVFETWASRQLKTLRWISVPTGPHSSGYLRMIDDFGDRAPAIYGAWIALVKIAAAAPTRGVLANGKGVPYTAGHLSRLSHFPAALFDELIAWATSPHVRWLEPVPADSTRGRPESGPTMPRPGPDQVEGTREPGRDQVGEAKKPGSEAAPTGTTRQDQTGPDTTRPDQTRPDRPSVGLSVVEKRLSGLSVDDAERFCERFRRVSRQPRSVLSPWILLGVICCDVAVRKGFATELAERLRSGSIRRPTQYVRSAIRKACEESDVDLDQFRQAVRSWTAQHFPTREGVEA